MIIVAGLITIGCQANSYKNILFPTERNIEIQMICSQAYSGPEAKHQAWEKSPVRWLFITEEKIIVYFENDRKRLLNMASEWKLAPGKYRCHN